MAEEPRKLSMYENIDKTCEKSERRSFFDKPDLMTQERVDDLEKWNLRWGKYNLDYVNVKYPEEYVQNIEEEKEMWLNGIDNINKRVKLINEEAAMFSDIVITDGILTAEQKTSLGVIDSKINEYIEKSTLFLREFQVYHRIQEMTLEKIEREKRMIETMTIANK